MASPKMASPNILNRQLAKLLSGFVTGQIAVAKAVVTVAAQSCAREMTMQSSCTRAQSFIPNRPFAQLWPGNEVRGIAGEIRLRCVCFSSELSFFFCFGMSFSDHCCGPGFFNRGRASPSLFSRGFSRSSELRKRWLLAIRQAGWSHFRVPNNTVVCIGHVLPATNFRFHARA